MVAAMRYCGKLEKDRSEVTLSVLSCRDVNRELPMEVTLAVSLPKGDRQKGVVEKCVELGVRRLIPLKTSRSVAQPVDEALNRLKRTVIEASKQCGRNRLMEIAAAQTWPELAAATRDASTRLLAHPLHGVDAAEPSASSRPGPVADRSVQLQSA